MKTPARVQKFHDEAVDLASQIIAAGSIHDPMMFTIKGESRIIYDIRFLFADHVPKPIAAETMKNIATEAGAELAAYLTEAWKAVIGPEVDIHDPEIVTENLPGAVECLVVQVELRSGGLWFWSHDIVRDDAGTRVLDTTSGPFEGFTKTNYRFVFFPQEEPCRN